MKRITLPLKPSIFSKASSIKTILVSMSDRVDLGVYMLMVLTSILFRLQHRARPCPNRRRLKIWFSTLDVESFADSSELSKAYGSRTAVNIRDILEKDDWKDEALRIPDREADVWEWTDPLSQIGWTIDKNARCSGRYVNVVKALKWWWRTQHPDKKYPKGYPLEHLIGDCCPDGIESVAEGVVLTLENIAKMGPSKPILLDRGLPNDVMARVSQDDYSTFHECVIEASCLAREAFAAEDARVASEKWQELFGAEFPLAPKSESKAAFTARAGAATILSEANFA